LEAKIGEGSLGEVFRVRTPKGKVQALKRLSMAHQDAAHREIFAREARIALQMQHPHLLGALQQGEVDGWPFYTLPLVPQSMLLRPQILPSGLPLPLLISLARHLGPTIGAVHALGFVHADLSPSNLYLTKDSLYLGDFGAAISLLSKQTRPLGTYCYMSPEQVQGETLSAASDVFSLGSLLWECCFGEALFARKEPFLSFRAVVEEEPPKGRAPFQKASLVLLQGLHKAPHKRIQSPITLCQAFLEALPAE